MDLIWELLRASARIQSKREENPGPLRRIAGDRVTTGFLDLMCSYAVAGAAHAITGGEDGSYQITASATYSSPFLIVGTYQAQFGLGLDSEGNLFWSGSAQGTPFAFGAYIGGGLGGAVSNGTYRDLRGPYGNAGANSGQGVPGVNSSADYSWFTKEDGSPGWIADIVPPGMPLSAGGGGEVHGGPGGSKTGKILNVCDYVAILAELAD